MTFIEKTIPKTKGLYIITDSGIIASFKTKKPRRCYLNKSTGYLQVVLCNNQKYLRTVYPHKELARLFIPNPH